MQTALQQQDDYLDAFRGRFTSLMRWHDLDAFWDNLKKQVDDGWYIYHVGDVPPESPVNRDKLLAFIDEIDKADIDFPNDLLFELDQLSFEVIETDHPTVQAQHAPIIFITSKVFYGF